MAVSARSMYFVVPRRALMAERFMAEPAESVSLLVFAGIVAGIGGTVVEGIQAFAGIFNG